jgi:mannose-1-phosphate guanylyltransferase/phosphomannomutase
MDRDRLTITLNKSLLAKIDNFIDGTKIRNRSHAIEYLIKKSLVPEVAQAVILAGGKGLNMRPFTFEMPKGLFPVGGKPILEHIIELLRLSEVRDVIFSIGHLGEKIKDHFGDGSRFGVKITYVTEDKEAGTGGALLLAKKHLKNDTFLVLHGDIMIDLNVSDFVCFHKEQGTAATIALTSVVDPSKFGEVVLNGTKVVRFIEKPEKGRQTSQLINSGFYVFNKEIFEYIPKAMPSFIEDIFPKLAEAKQLSGFLFAGRWVDIGTPASYERAIKEWGKEKK